MQIAVSARHGHLHPETQARIREKVEKLRRYFDRLTAIQVTVDLEHRETPDVEVCISAEHTSDFVATASGELMAALDRVLHKVEQQLRRHKEKVTGHRATGLKRLGGSLEDQAP
ncbi:MAG TPA: ribosome-associated translation inhibitor RaiA [Planctomycetaceae bacterium]|nr:ribosome-associated translation inhibitor RaiA [Planctomycetaceae bacterium]